MAGQATDPKIRGRQIATWVILLGLITASCSGTGSGIETTLPTGETTSTAPPTSSTVAVPTTTAPTTTAPTTTTSVPATTTVPLASDLDGFGDFEEQCVGVNVTENIRTHLGSEPEFDDLGAVVTIEGIEFRNSGILVVPEVDLSVPVTVADTPVSQLHAKLAFNHTRPHHLAFRWVEDARIGYQVLGADLDVYATWDGNTISYTDGTPDEVASFSQINRVTIATLPNDQRESHWEVAVAWAEDLRRNLKSISGFTEFTPEALAEFEKSAADLDEIEKTLCDLASMETFIASDLWADHQSDTAWLSDHEAAFHRLTSAQQMLLAHEYAQIIVAMMNEPDVDWFRSISDEEASTGLDGRTSVYEEIVVWAFAGVDALGGALFLADSYRPANP